MTGYFPFPNLSCSIIDTDIQTKNIMIRMIEIDECHSEFMDFKYATKIENNTKKMPDFFKS
jgi:hypothetical protein